MKICVAQLKPVKGDIEANIIKHITAIEHAVEAGANAIFFSELSLTGYEPELAKDLATTPNDTRLDIFQNLSDKFSMTIGVGLPTQGVSGIHISMICFQPQKVRAQYSKQQLHADELSYFVEGNGQLLLTIGLQVIAPGICYESLQKNHSDDAVKLGATIYVASVAKSENGIIKGDAHYPAVAASYSIPVLLSNSIGFSDNFMSVGKSSVWTKDGKLSARLHADQEGLLIYDTDLEKAMLIDL